MHFNISRLSSHGTAHDRVWQRTAIKLFSGLPCIIKSDQDLQSWTKVLGQMCTCGSLQTRETKSRATFNLHELNPSPHPSYNVESTDPQLFLTFNIVLGGGGGNCNVDLKYGNAFRRSAQIFDNYEFCITVPRMILSRIVALLQYDQQPSRSAWGATIC